MKLSFSFLFFSFHFFSFFFFFLSLRTNVHFYIVEKHGIYKIYFDNYNDKLQQYTYLQTGVDGVITDGTKHQTTEDMLSESPRCNDMVADLHFPRFIGTAIQCEIARRFSKSVVKVGLNVQCKKISVFWMGLNLEPRRI